MSLIKITQNKTKDENQRNVLFPLDNRHFITVLGITCNTLSNLGVGAFSTLPYAVSFLTFLTFGQANIVFLFNLRLYSNDS